MDVISKKLNQLNELYSELPETVGCTGRALCCMVQHPHCYYIEFVNMMEFINSNWTSEQKNALHLDCIKNYLSNTVRKRCVFLSDEKLCKIYSVRDYNCRCFGLIPKKSYKKRVKNAQKRNPGINLDLKCQTDCCKGLKPAEIISQKNLNQIFQNISDLDEDLIAEEDRIQAGNYMTFHDHYILFYFSENMDVLQNITSLKVNGSEEHKTLFIKEMKKEIESH